MNKTEKKIEGAVGYGAHKVEAEAQALKQKAEAELQARIAHNHKWIAVGVAGVLAALLIACWL